MNLGFALPTGAPWATPASLTRIAEQGEACGYHSLWVFQRLLYAVEPKNEHYGAPGQSWPAAFESVLDPLVTLSFIASRTRTIRLGTSVLVMPFYSPVVLAKQLATLDLMAEGRLSVGLGLGWSRDEYDAVGVSWERRGARADEFVRCLKTVWTDAEVEFQGEFYTVPRSRIAPKPLQKPHPPLLIGGYSTASLRRAARLGDGYTGGNMPPEMMADVIRRFHEAALSCGRDPETIQVVSRASFHVTDGRLGAGRRVFWGSVAQILDDMRRYEEGGVTELFLDPTYQPGGGTLGQVLTQMELFAPDAEPVSRRRRARTPAILRSVGASALPAPGPRESRRYSGAW